MLQAVMVKPGMIEFRNVPAPEINAEEVLIEMKRIGVCGSDIHVYHGKHPYTSYPVVQGHEVAGVIVKLGAKVAGFKPGDKVTIQPQVCCGRCYSCRHGKYHICDDLKVMGFQTTGAASEYFAVAAAKVVKLPDEMSFDAGAMIEPLAVAVHALGRAGMNLKGLNVLVLGAGPIGNLVAQAARGMGAAAVMITDISGYRLGIAESCGIDYCLNPEQQNLGTMLADQFGADKADLILECVGANPTMNQAIEYARKGSSLIVVGVFGDRANLDMGLVQDRELQLIGTLMYQEQDYLQAIELVKEGQVRLEPLITNHFPFQDYQKAYEFIEDRKDRTMKVIIALNDH
jgi:L-iditol 2-dehydrogenase